MQKHHARSAVFYWVILTFAGVGTLWSTCCGMFPMHAIQAAKTLPSTHQAPQHVCVLADHRNVSDTHGTIEVRNTIGG